MNKIGRNSPCPCDSGKKFKKCCIDKPKQFLSGESFLNYIESFMSYEEVDQMKTEEIIKRLEDMGIKFDNNTFMKEITECYLAQQISESWFQKFEVLATGRDEDFPFYAAWVLWDRLAPEHLLSMEKMTNLVEEGFERIEEKKYSQACDLWLKVWEALKCRFRKEDKDLGFLEEQYGSIFIVRNFVQDLEEELYNAGRQDKTYFDKRIDYCREFLNYFPEENELIIHKMRRAIAEAYENLGNFEQAERTFEEIVRDYPENPWSYIGWGDMNQSINSISVEKARGLYLKALEVAGEDKEMMSIIEERLEDLGGK